MDQSNQHYINMSNNNPLHFTIRLPNSPNPTSAQSTIPNPNPNSNPIPPHLISLTIPRKRRRGRPRNSPPNFNQVLNLPSSSSNNFGHNFGNLQGSNYANAVKPTGFGFGRSKAVSDVNDEIIVINKEATAEALIALTSGFPADSLTDDEIEAGVVSVVGGIEQVNYILIRNHIITKWRENVSQYITKEMFLDVIPKHCSRLLDSSYSYLVSRGYINFGVSAALKERIPVELSKQQVIVIGAGFAGLAAARQLMAFGFKVTVLEGRKRAGGRVYTRAMEGSGKTAAADLGGSVLTGTLGNPLGILARQLSCTLHKIRDKCPLYRPDGKPVDLDLDQKVEHAFNRLLDKASKLRESMGEVSQDVSLGAALETFREVYGDAVTEEELSLFNWHLANLEYANAGLVSKLSLAFWDQDDPYDMGGDHCFLAGGNGKLVHALTDNVTILYEKTVQTIHYGADGVQVNVGGQVFEGDMVLCTVPLGVLKSGSIKFIPELPQRKLDAIKRLGFGLLNKVAMLFPRVFWGTDLDTFGHLCSDPNRRGEFFLFYSYATVAGGALLIALVAGEAAHKFETMPPTDAVAYVLQILKGIYEPQGIEVPEPIQTVCTRWGSDPFSFGSYSNVAVGASGDDYDILAESVGDGRLFFAGEATNRRYPATMHGAFLSGLREAANMSHRSAMRSSQPKVEKNPSKSAHSCASILADLFRDPDLEFGSFSVIFGKGDLDPKSTAILRVTFSGPRKRSQEGLKHDQQHSNKLLFQQLQSHFNQQQELHVYTLISRQQALELREVRGGDEMRLNYLCEKLGVKLVGRKGLGPSAESIIASIKSERANRKPALGSMGRKSGTPKLKAVSMKQKLVRKAKILGKSSGLAYQNAGGDITQQLRHINTLSKSVGRVHNHAALNPVAGAKVASNGGFPCLPNTTTGTELVGNSRGTSMQSSMVRKNLGASMSNNRWISHGTLPNYSTLPKSVVSSNFSSPSNPDIGARETSGNAVFDASQLSNVDVQTVKELNGLSTESLMVQNDIIGCDSKDSGIAQLSNFDSAPLSVGASVVKELNGLSTESLMVQNDIIGCDSKDSDIAQLSNFDSAPLSVGASVPSVVNDSGYVAQSSNSNVGIQLECVASVSLPMMIEENFMGGISSPPPLHTFENCTMDDIAPPMEPSSEDDNFMQKSWMGT